METVTSVLVTSGVSKPPEGTVRIFGVVDATVHSRDSEYGV